MIKFEIGNKGTLKTAIFQGDISTISADVGAMISLIYGAMVKKDKNSAELFKLNMTMMLADNDLRKKIFSSDLVDSIGGTKIDSESVKFDRKELIKQIMEELFDDEGE